MIEKFLTALYADDNVLYFIEGSGDFIFPCNGIGILSVNLNNINIDNTIYDEDCPENGGMFACLKMRRKETEIIFTE